MKQSNTKKQAWYAMVFIPESLVEPLAKFLEENYTERKETSSRSKNRRNSYKSIYEMSDALDFGRCCYIDNNHESLKATMDVRGDEVPLLFSSLYQRYNSKTGKKISIDKDVINPANGELCVRLTMHRR